MSKFMKGQYVRIKDSLIVGNRYGNLTLVSGMDEFKGLVTRVRKNSREGNYLLEGDSGFYWSAEMLEPVSCGLCEYGYKQLTEAPCCDCDSDFNLFTPPHTDKLEVNPPSLEALEKYIVDTTRAIFEADEEHNQLEVYELKFIENLLTACCKHKIIRLARKEDNDGNS